jgi:hypothetical protein
MRDNEVNQSEIAYEQAGAKEEKSKVLENKQFPGDKMPQNAHIQSKHKPERQEIKRYGEYR